MPVPMLRPYRQLTTLLRFLKFDKEVFSSFSLAIDIKNGVAIDRSITYLKAGINPDSLEDAFKIIGHLLEEIGKLGVNMTVGNKIEHVSNLETPNGTMVIVSHISVKEGKPPIVYLNTITYAKR